MRKNSKTLSFALIIFSGFLPVLCGLLAYQSGLTARLSLPLQFAIADGLVMGACYFAVPALFFRMDKKVFCVPAWIFTVTLILRTWAFYKAFFVLLYGLPVLWIVRAGYFKKAAALSFSAQRQNHTANGVLAGAAGGIFLLLHLFITLSFASKPHLKPLVSKEIFYWLFYGLFLSGFYEEFFYRGFLMKKFSEFHFTFWESALCSLFFYVLKYATLPRIYGTPSLAFGTLFYAGIVSVVSALLLRKTGNLWACVLMNAVFYTGANFIA